MTKNTDFEVFVGKEPVIFSTKIYRDHIDILLSELGYSELVQRLFEKMTFFRVDPLALNPNSSIRIRMSCRYSSLAPCHIWTLVCGVDIGHSIYIR